MKNFTFAGSRRRSGIDGVDVVAREGELVEHGHEAPALDLLAHLPGAAPGEALAGDAPSA